MLSLDLDAQVCHSLYSATNALIRAYRPILAPLDLTYPQYVVMMSLWQHDNVSVKQLGSHTRLDSSTLTPILKRLEQKGLLERRHSADDERQKQLVLTGAGKKLKMAAKKVPEQIACATRAEASKARQLKKLCEELYQVLEA